MIRDANDLEYIEGRYCYFDYGQTLLPLRSDMRIAPICGKDVAWITEGAMERRQAANSVANAFSGQSARVARFQLADSWPVVVEARWMDVFARTAFAPVVDHAADPSASFMNWSYVNKNASGLSAQDVICQHFDASIGSRSGYGDAHLVQIGPAQPGDPIRADRLLAAFDNLKYSTSFIGIVNLPRPYGQTVLSHTYRNTFRGQDKGALTRYPDGNVWYGIYERGWYEFGLRDITPYGEALADIYYWRWEKWEVNSANTRTYTIDSVPGASQVSLGALARFSVSCPGTAFEQIYNGLIWVPIQSKSSGNSDAARYPVAFRESDISTAIMNAIKRNVNIANYRTIDVTTPTNDDEVHVVVNYEPEYPQKYFDILISDVDLVVKIDLSDHTKWWSN